MAPRLQKQKEESQQITLLARICHCHHDETKKMTAEAQEKGGKSSHSFNLSIYVSVSERREEGK